MVKVAHTGDAHVDSDTHGGINPKTGLNRAWESNLAALVSCAEHAVNQEVDAFVHAGDAFKNGRPSQEAVLMFADALIPVARAGIPIVLLDGNHDRISVPIAQRTATATIGHILGQYGEVHQVEREPELVRLANGLQIGCLPWLSKSTILARLGLERMDPAQSDKAVVDYGLRAVEKMNSEADTGAPFILASHVTVDDVRIDSIAKGQKRGSEVEIAHLFAEPVLPRKELEKVDASYIALSHIHARQRIGTKCFYAGAPNRITFTDADDPKSLNIVTISDDNTLEAVDHHATDARPMTSIPLEDKDAEDRLDALVEGALVRLVLPAGESVVPTEVKEKVSAAGATLAVVKTTPADRPRQSSVTLPEKINPVTALGTWLEEKSPEADAAYVTDLAARLVEEVEQ